MLFFGNIAPYKGLDYLVAAFFQLSKSGSKLSFTNCGKAKATGRLLERNQTNYSEERLVTQIRQKIEYIPDEETEVYFKAADVLILPYSHVFQSGVLFLGYSFGLPAIVTDVGSLREEIVEGETGFVARPQDPLDLARAISCYFGSDLYRNLDDRRRVIRQYANDRYSWSKVAAVITNVYSSLLAA